MRERSIGHLGADMPSNPRSLPFSILPRANAWIWRTLSPHGEIVSAGVAPSQQLAAACVIRALAHAEVDSAATYAPAPGEPQRSAA